MLIKCPECGRQVSEKAPVCPNCGVQIAGKITRCRNCGEVFFTDEGFCPECHQSAVVAPVVNKPYTAAPQEQPVQQRPEPQKQSQSASSAGEGGEPEKKKKTAPILLSVIFAAIVCAGLFYWYSQVQGQKETEEYEFVIRSTDPEVLQSYLARFPDAPVAHRDSVESRLLMLQKGDEEWQNAVLSNSRAAIQRYLDNNPNTTHRQEALNKIDSLDWAAVQNSSDITEVEQYAKTHPDGRYIDDANVLLSKLKSTTVLPDERSMVTSLFRQFFQSINAKDENRLASTVAMVMDTFLGKSNATSSDVLTFLHKIYKEDVSNMNWHIDPSSYKIEKREVAEDEYEYTVSFNAEQIVERGGSEQASKFRISAKVTSDGKISSFDLTKVS